MIRVILFLVFIGIVAMGAAWLADRPGDVTIVWLGRRIETSVMVLAAAIAFIAALAAMAWSLLSLLLRSRHIFARARANRRRNQSQRAISRGLVAIGAGDTAAARRYAAEAERLAPDEPLALLLAAQMAQATGDRTGAERAFGAMAERSDTKLLGMRGLYIEAQRRNDPEAARHYAEAAAHAAPALPWASHAVIEDRCVSGDWAGALSALERMKRAGLVDKPTHRRRRAVLLTARAMAEASDDPARAKTHVLEAVRLAPNLVPAAAMAGKLLAESNELRKAARIVETAWRAEPHPDLSEVYVHLRYGDSARDRLARAQTLARLMQNHPEGALAVARAAMVAHDFTVARAALTPLTRQPTQRVALLMAELEEVEHGDVGRAREWMTRALRAARDPAWVADGIVSDRWQPVSPVTGTLDAFEWRVPVGELAAPVIEERNLPPAPALTSRPGQDSLQIEQPRPAAVASAAAAPAAAAHASGNSGAATDAPAHSEPVVDAVIPLVHAPDDPGTEEPPPAEPPRRRSLFG
jgi:HemY protein